MILAHNGTCTMHCNIMTDLRIARETGYDGIEIIGYKLYRYLDQGFTLESLLPHLQGLTPVGLGYVQDIERQAPDEYGALLQETERMCAAAETLGCPMVQLLTGPINPGLGLPISESYKQVAALPWPELLKVTAKNLRALCDIANRHHVKFYLEPLSWAPLHTLKQAFELLDATGRDNVLLLVDFWHLWTSGITPDEVAMLDKNIIAGVQVCDSLRPKGGHVSHLDREVWTGGGCIPLKEWVDAVRATGFDGWWTAELFSPKHWEMDPWEVAHNLREMMVFLMA